MRGSNNSNVKFTMVAFFKTNENKIILLNQLIVLFLFCKQTNGPKFHTKMQFLINFKNIIGEYFKNIIPLSIPLRVQVPFPSIALSAESLVVP